MDVEQPGQQMPRRRGRPPGSRKKQAITPLSPESLLPTSATRLPGGSQGAVLEEERVMYMHHEEKLSPFSRLLVHILHENRAEITRVAKEMDIAEITLSRWMSGSSMPRQMHLRRLVEVLPEYRGDLVYAIQQTFPDALYGYEQTPGKHEVSKETYHYVLTLARDIEADDERHWQVMHHIFETAMQQLDAERHGLAITYAKLMSAHEDGVHSLREVVIRGQAPWPYDIENRVFLGSTTLAGTAAMTQRLQTWDNLSDEERLMVDIDEFERSAAACPVMHAGRIAGVLIVSSAQAGFFMDRIACQSVEEYALLMATGLSESDFYAPDILKLRPMPSLRWQRAEIGRSYTSRILAYAHKNRLSRQEAEQKVILEIEHEFELKGRTGEEQYPFAPYYTSSTSSDALLQ